MHRFLYALFIAFLVVVGGEVRAEVIRVEVESETVVLNGRAFGAYGAYELLEGCITFGIDPAHPMNARIVDLQRAPRNENGLVEATANFAVLQPVDSDRRRGVGVVEVSNRGGMFSPSYFNRASTSSLDPSDPEAWGDALLMRQGLTVIWVGWQWDVPRDGDERLRLQVPRARHHDGSAISGLVRSDWVIDEAVQTLSVAHRDHVAYPAADFDHPDNLLTMRTGRNAPRQTIPRARWQFARTTDDGVTVSDSTHITLQGGFEAGMIYELVYRAEDPAVVGLGLAAIRDVISHAKYDADTRFPVEHGIAVGVSQTGRFLRHFLYQGFNTDEQGRPAYDGIYAITAGAGRGSFNHRFAQPSRDAHRYSAFFYPTDIFPFTSQVQHDPRTWQSDGLLAHAHHADHIPKMFQVNTGYEYWGRAASLIHTTVDGTRDMALHPNERIYHLASAQHFPWQFPPPEEMQQETDPAVYRGNPLDQSVNYRALLVRMVEWVDEETAPPESQYPRIETGTLAAVEAVDAPAIPGLAFPKVMHTAYRADYGPRWRTDGVVTAQPPRLDSPFPGRVPQVDSLGNEVGGVRNVGVRAPLATYLPWNLRVDAPANKNEMTDFYGTYVPLPTTKAKKEATGDPRPSIETLYDSRSAYQDQVQQAADALIEQGFLLPDDRERVVERAAQVWTWVHEGHE
ncbi:hypothetical protein CRI93_11310 [Longimonas halophila]|uniref:Alpha/beta hydrolase domain-containing protein n=2 Tax=Longimonas halophila TaxID=1469170 RepID=A0A2H3NK97_9BACT|nr:alpha/beta hydrolase domain-containing protein [Longimonas halophila]PEN06059.1 hypothetical protein CRI93_11310 [Longimonas halophila]